MFASSKCKYIFESKKLDFFKSVYIMGRRPPYVDILKNRSDRAAICKICISAHTLMIERGRHLNIPRNERYCSVCNSGQIENEKHFLLHCEKYSTKRDIFYHKVSNIIVDPTKFQKHENNIIFLLNNNSYTILKLTSFFISDSLNLRKAEQTL